MRLEAVRFIPAILPFGFYVSKVIGHSEIHTSNKNLCENGEIIQQQKNYPLEFLCGLSCRFYVSKIMWACLYSCALRSLYYYCPQAPEAYCLDFRHAS